MDRQEIASKLSRLSEIVGEAKEIISSLETFCKEMDEEIGPYSDIRVEMIPISDCFRRRFLVGCEAHEVENLQQLIGYCRRDLLYWRNIGRAIVDDLAECLKREYGIEWK